MSASPVLEFDQIVQEFPRPLGGGALRVLDGISFQVRPGQFIAVIGPSGCGKSTLLHMAAGSAGADLRRGAASRARRWRRSTGRSASCRSRRNSFRGRRCARMSSCRWCCGGLPPTSAGARRATCLAAVGLTGFEHHYPHQLSGGMQKRGVDRAHPDLPAGGGADGRAVRRARRADAHGDAERPADAVGDAGSRRPSCSSRTI